MNRFVVFKGIKSKNKLKSYKSYKKKKGDVMNLKQVLVADKC